MTKTALGLAMLVACTPKIQKLVVVPAETTTPVAETSKPSPLPAEEMKQVANLPPAIAIAVGREIACAVTQDGGVRCWSLEGKDLPLAQTRPAIREVKSISAFGTSVCAAQGTGKIACWGEGAPWSSVDGSVTWIGGASDAIKIAVGHRHGCALLRSGEVACWGESGLGCLGSLNQPATYTELIRVPRIRDAVDVAVSNFGACAVRQNGHVICWGSGDITPWAPSGPIAPPQPSETILRPTELRFATDVASVNLEWDACIVHRNGHVSCWSLTDRATMHDEGLVNIVDAQGIGDAASISGDLLLRKNGTLVQIDDDDKLYTARTLMSPTDVIQVAQDRRLYACALKRGGNVVCWHR